MEQAHDVFYGPPCPRRLFVRNLPYSASEERVRDYFGYFGALSMIKVPPGEYENNRGFAIIEYAEHKVAEKVLTYGGYGHHSIGGRCVTVTVCEPRQRPQQSGPVTLFVSPLRSTTTSEIIRSYFEPMGDLGEVRVVDEDVAGKTRSRRFAYVTFLKAEIAQEVRKRWPHKIDGSSVRLDFFNVEKEYLIYSERQSMRLVPLLDANMLNTMEHLSKVHVPDFYD
uniref:RRM domain-containing protein n=1 Tax=Steinernema glaseri TaxID=37863 RepID=A0A1I7YSK1_9BILA